MCTKLLGNSILVSVEHKAKQPYVIILNNVLAILIFVSAVQPLKHSAPIAFSAFVVGIITFVRRVQFSKVSSSIEVIFLPIVIDTSVLILGRVL